MIELIEKWRSDLETLKRDTTSKWEIARLEQCANELEEAMKPRPIESAPRFVQISTSITMRGLAVIKHIVAIDSEGRAWQKTINGKDVYPWVSLGPLPTIGGEE